MARSRRSLIAGEWIAHFMRHARDDAAERGEMLALRELFDDAVTSMRPACSCAQIAATASAPVKPMSPPSSQRQMVIEPVWRTGITIHAKPSLLGVAPAITCPSSMSALMNARA